MIPTLESQSDRQFPTDNWKKWICNAIGSLRRYTSDSEADRFQM